ncbi:MULTISPECIES: hypothetical protein [Niastella]|uniref:DUF4296 domain-containing protein n=1 Tax=Niastella soli TaxID=2821487 RepID=A0ABS3Z1J4_9BACT|nr:hypothetical protein [Niastella soli]MBO9204023.1 hypothetical protein [Niastella soli]
MKKIIISGLATMAIGVAVLIGCSKKSTDVQSAALTTSENTTSATKNARLATLDLSSENGGGGLSCNCTPPKVSCSANCILSICCVCYNPATEYADCQCFFGFAYCRVVRSATARAETGTSSPKITIYNRRMQLLFRLLKSKYKAAEGLYTAYDACKGKSARVNYTESYIADNTSYETFINKYKAFVNSLTETQRETLQKEINSLK